MAPPEQVSQSRVTSIPAGDVTLEGDLQVPPSARAVVVFAHGSGSSRHSTRNQYVARVLRISRLGTLLFDLLTPEEEEWDAPTGHLRFDVELLARRLAQVTEWLRGQLPPALPIGYFGASTGAAAALIAAARQPELVRAIVSRGGRPDLAAQALPHVQAPTLLIVGSRDTLVLELNRQALAQLNVPKELAIIPDATHLFVEEGALDAVARIAVRWFQRNLEQLPRPS
jgi:putative phosphoribosyl transferase